MIEIKELSKSSKFPPQIVNQALSSIGYFKTDNRNITTLFQDEVKYLN